ncbi:MAG: hypothetical protein U0586_13885 [Candidatus Brocadiaceae bacterium]
MSSIMKRIFSIGVVVALLMLSVNVAFAVIINVDAKLNSVSGGIGKTTGLMVVPGKLYVISVDKRDTWNLSSNDPNYNVNANGVGNPYGNNGIQQSSTKGAFTFLNGSLVGSLDGGVTFFPVGTKMEMTALRSGPLTLYCWDSDNYNNSGSVAADVEVYYGPAN